MGFRFRKSINLLPGAKLNLSKSGISFTVGKRGKSVSFSNRGVRTTVGLPGTGMSYTSTSSTHKTKAQKHRLVEVTPRRASFLDISQPYSGAAYAKREELEANKAQWGCASLILGISLFLGFLIIGQQPAWAFGSLGLFGLIYILCIKKPHYRRDTYCANSTTDEIIAKAKEINTESSLQMQEALDFIDSNTDKTALNYINEKYPLLIKAAILSLLDKSIAASTIQKRYQIGYSHAKQIIDTLLSIGVIERQDRSLYPKISLNELPAIIESLLSSKWMPTVDKRIQID